VFEKKFHIFPHPEPAVDLTLDHVADWFTVFPQNLEYEILGLVRGDTSTRRERISATPDIRNKRPGGPALSEAYEYFAKGHTFILNTIHQHSDHMRRFTRDLQSKLGYAIDASMYLAPPYSMSYGYHNDEMDAWIVQIAGEKNWNVCNRVFHNSEQQAFFETANKSSLCTDVHLQAGDVMYIPFGTMHHVVAGDEMSSHLTVNIERQFHTWASLLRSAFVALAYNFQVPPETYVQSLQGEEAAIHREDAVEDPFVVLTHRAREVIELSRAPRGSHYIVGSISNQDLPARFLSETESEIKSICKKLKPFAVKRDSDLSIQYGPRRKNHRLSEMITLVEKHATKLVPWLIEVDRFRRFNDLTGHASVPSPREVFSSIARIRAATVQPHMHATEAIIGMAKSPQPSTSIRPAGSAGKGSSPRHELLVKDGSTMRLPPDSLVLLTGSTLYVGGRRYEVKDLRRREDVPVEDSKALRAGLLYCLGRFSPNRKVGGKVEGTVGGTFQVKDIPLSNEDERAGLASFLLRAGALNADS